MWLGHARTWARACGWDRVLRPGGAAACDSQRRSGTERERGVWRGHGSNLARSVRAAGRSPEPPQQPRGREASVHIYFLTVANGQVPFYVHCNQFITKETFALCNDAFGSNKRAAFSSGEWRSSFAQAVVRVAPRGPS